MNEALTTEAQMAIEALGLVEELATKLGAAEGLLEAGYAQFAQALLDVQKNRYWETDFESWGAYFAHVCEKFKLGSRQLYHKVATVKELDGVVQLSDLTDMGITKASVLAAAHRGGAEISEDMVAQAKDASTTAKLLKKQVAQTLHQPETPDDDWIDLGFAFYASDDERAELREAEKIARGIDPPISNSLPEHSQKREIAIRWCREFLATYAIPEDPEDEETLDSQENS